MSTTGLIISGAALAAAQLTTYGGGGLNFGGLNTGFGGLSGLNDFTGGLAFAGPQASGTLLATPTGLTGTNFAGTVNTAGGATLNYDINSLLGGNSGLITGTGLGQFGNLNAALYSPTTLGNFGTLGGGFGGVGLGGGFGGVGLGGGFGGVGLGGGIGYPGFGGGIGYPGFGGGIGYPGYPQYPPPPPQYPPPPPPQPYPPYPPYPPPPPPPGYGCRQCPPPYYGTDCCRAQCRDCGAPPAGWVGPPPTGCFGNPNCANQPTNGAYCDANVPCSTGAMCDLSTRRCPVPAPATGRR